MSGAGLKLAPAPQNNRTPLAHLLHALNQPLTGLQCSMELALAGPARPDRYLVVLREGLGLVGRMRTLVDGIRELVEFGQCDTEADTLFALDSLVHEITSDFQPVAESRKVRLLIGCRSDLLVRAQFAFLARMIFRLLDSVLSLAREDTEVSISMSATPIAASLTVSWEDVSLAGNPQSPAHLGLLIAQAGCEQTGAEWHRQNEGGRQCCTVRLPLAARTASKSAEVAR